jgi:hypothetical protein
MLDDAGSSLCAFGCGRPAIKQLKNGKLICAASANQCPVMRQRNSDGLRGRNPFESRPHPRGMAGKPAWNRGLTWERMYGDAKAQQMRSIVRSNIARTRKLSPANEQRRRQKLSEVARRRGLGQYRPGSGRGRRGRYKGYWCDNSYELAVIIYCLDHDIAIQRNTESFPYTYGGQARRWIPDFKFPDGRFLEVKGYLTEQVLAKAVSFPHPLRVVFKRDIPDVFAYVEATYGKNFTRLYE